MARYVIVVKVPHDGSLTDTATEVFQWEVRELLSDGTGTLQERSGPTLVTGKSATAAEARFEAETWAERLAEETAYVYNTNTMEPTPPSP